MNENQKWPDNKEDFDLRYLRVFGYCNATSCPRSWHCYRSISGCGANNKTWVPRPDKYDECEWYVRK